MGQTVELNALLFPAIVFLAASSLIVPIFRKIGLSSVMAFLLIGVLMGPDGLGRLAVSMPWARSLVLDPEGPAQWLAELGVVFLLFSIGLEVSTDRLWALRRLVLGLGTAQVLVTAVAIGAIALMFRNQFATAVVVGLAFALSSTAVVLQILGERRQLAGPVGRTAFSILLLQDLAVIPILLVVSATGTGAAENSASLGGVLQAVFAALFAIVSILIGGRFLVRPLFRWVASIDSREVFVATALLVVIVSAMASQAAGASMALGAFLAGMLLAGTEFRHEIETDLEPFKGLLLGLFFVTVGVEIDLDQVYAMPLPVVAGLVGLVLVKATIIVPLVRLFGLSWSQAIATGFLLAQAGEFAFVIVTFASDNGAIPAGVSDYMLLIIAASLFSTPLVANGGAWIADRVTTDAARNVGAPAIEQERHVIVAGYGRVGQAIGALLDDQKIRHVALDTDISQVTKMHNRGWPVQYGDASRVDVLKALGAAKAAAIVVTINDADGAERIVKAAQTAWPHVPVLARARDADHAKRLHASGAVFAHPDTIESMLQLADALLNRLGTPDETVRRILNERRQQELRQAKTG